MCSLTILKTHDEWDSYFRGTKLESKVESPSDKCNVITFVNSYISKEDFEEGGLPQEHKDLWRETLKVIAYWSFRGGVGGDCFMFLENKEMMNSLEQMKEKVLTLDQNDLETQKLNLEIEKLSSGRTHVEKLVLNTMKKDYLLNILETRT